MDENLRKLIFQAIDDTISPADFDRLQDAIEQNEAVREEYLRAVSLTESLSEIAALSEKELLQPGVADSSLDRDVADRRKEPGRFSLTQLAMVAITVILASGIGYWLGQGSHTAPTIPVADQEKQDPESIEAQIAGHATLRRSLNLKWPENVATYREGDVISDGTLKFISGIAEIDFFCGASLIVEGPATLEVESDWSVRVLEGRLRANVPPAARGFIVKAGDLEIVDLGTEFALDVGFENTRVEVLDGDVELRGGNHDGQHLTTGQRRLLAGSAGPLNPIEGLSTIGELIRQRDDAESERFEEWKKSTEQFRQDDRLIAYYPIASNSGRRVVRNMASAEDNRDGHPVGAVEWTNGRFGPASTGLEFDRPGARVRTRIDGEFQAFTFACWAKIDSLEHRYNALFMGDGYENGEPHWQIRDDGSLMFSVMVDDTQEIRHFSQEEQRMVTHAGLHRVYYSKPFWDISKSGQWFHLAAVYDPTGRRVVQYVNGEQISSEEILDKFHIESLRIGAAEIGNWGQPFRKTPWFAVRNLNGTIDELAVYNAALTSDEISTLYEKGKPLGY